MNKFTTKTNGIWDYFVIKLIKNQNYIESEFKFHYCELD